MPAQVAAKGGEKPSTPAPKLAPGWVAVKSGWTDTSRTYQNPDGTYTQQSYGGRVNYKDGSGTWQEVDTTLVAATSGPYTMASKANDLGLALNDTDASSALAQIKVGSATVKLRAPGYGRARISPRLGNSANKPDARGPAGGHPDPIVALAANDGVGFDGSNGWGTLTVTPTTDGFEFGAVLADKNASSTYIFVLDTGGLKATLDADGHSVDLAKNAAAPLGLQISAPMLLDAAGKGSSPDAVRTFVVHPGDKDLPAPQLAPQVAALRGNEVLLVYSISSDWLAAPDRAYPVTLDPSATVCSGNTNTCAYMGYYDQALISAQPDASSHWTSLRLGTDGWSSDGGNYGTIRELLKFQHLNLGSSINGPWGPNHIHVTSATLALEELSNYGSLTMGVVAGRATKAWTTYSPFTDSSGTWTRMAGNAVMSPNDVAQSCNGHGSGFSCALAINVTDIVSSWYTANPAAAHPDYGFMLESEVESRLELDLALSTNSNQDWRPKLTITYSIPTVTITGTQGGWTHGRTLSWSYTPDQGSDQAASYVELSTSSTFSSRVFTPTSVSGSATSYVIPSSVSLVDGTTYYWRVTASDGSGVSQPSNTGSFRWDGTPPAAPTSTAPSANPGFLKTTSPSPAPFAWTPVTDTSGIASYEVTTQSLLSSSPGSCAGTWTSASPVTVTATSYTPPALQTGYCYRLLLRSLDNAGNWSLTYSTSNPILIDTNVTSALPGPVVGDDCPTKGSCYRIGNTIYFQPSAPKTLTLTATGPTTPSGIVSSTFGPLSNPTGWTYTPGTVTGNPASIQLTWSSAATSQNPLLVYSTDGATVQTQSTTITLIPDAGAMAAFAAPVSGTQTAPVLVGSPLSINWTETAGLSAVTARSMQRMVANANSDSTCPAGGYSVDGAAASPTNVSGSSWTLAVPANTLTGGHCYQWVVTLTDSLGPNSFTTASVFGDNIAPVVAISSPAANQPLAGTLNVTGTATETYFASAVLSYGAGASPSSWTTIGTIDSPVSGGTLGVWATGSLAPGVYTLKLVATDQAGIVSSTTVTVYVDNTDRDTGDHDSAVPFDLDGGWNLSVNVASGEAHLSRDLFSIPSYGPEQSLSLSYNSLDPSTSGLFGAGWSSNLTQYLSYESGFVVWHGSDGARVPFGKVGSVWTPLVGNFETLSVNSTSGNYVVTDTDQTKYTFDQSSGRLLALTDRFGNSLTLSWSATSGSASLGTGSYVQSSAMVISNSQITQVTDSAGRVWHFGYTGSKLTTITDPAGNVTTFGYTVGDQLSSITRPRTPYGGAAANVIWTIGYASSSAPSAVTSVADPIGGSSGATTFTYAPSEGQTTVRAVPDSTSLYAPPSATTTYTYESHGWVTQIQDALGYLTNVGYYPSTGLMQYSWRQVGSANQPFAKTSWTYDPLGNVLTSTDPAAIKTTYMYDTNPADASYNEETSEIVSGGTGSNARSSTTQYLYDPSSGHVCRKIENPVSADVAALAHPCTDSLAGAESDPSKNVDTRYSYAVSSTNPYGQLASATDPNGVVTQFEYDGYGNRTAEVKDFVSGATPDSQTNVTTAYAYDRNTTAGKAGLVTSETNPIGITTSYVYNSLGNVLKTTMPGDTDTPAQQTTNGYDEFGATISVTTEMCSGNGATCSGSSSSWTTVDTVTTILDKRGRQTSQTDTTAAATTTTHASFDLAGDEYSDTAADGSVASKTFDALGRVATSAAAGESATSYYYDGIGDDVCTVAPASGNATSYINPANPAACAAIAAPSGTAAQSATAKSFDLDGNVTSETADVTGTPQTTIYLLDAIGRTYQTTDPAGLVTVTTYDGVGRVIQSVADSSVTDTVYDRAGNVLKSSAPHAPEATPLYTVTAYDKLDRARTVTDPAGATTTTYYDAASETIATVDAKGAVARNFYNAEGQAYKNVANCSDDGTHPSANPTACTGSATPTLPTVNVISTNTYSVTGHLVSSTTTSGTITTTTKNDGAGRIISSIVDPAGLGLETDHGYDTAGRQITVTSPAGTAAAPTTVVSWTVYDIDGRVCRTIQNATLDPRTLSDPCYGPIAAKTGSVDVDTQYHYDAAGNKTQEVAANGTVTLYTYGTAGQVASMIADYVSGEPTDGPGGVNATTSYYYDSDGRLIATAAPNSTAGSYTVTRNKYDESGNLTQQIANCTSVGTTPDADPAACTGNGTADAQTNVVTRYGYNSANQKISMTAPSPANGASGTATVTTAYAYDSNSRLCMVVENATGIAAGSLTCASTLTSTATTNVVTTYGYDANGNLSDQWTPSSAGSGTSHTSYAHDPLGHATSETDPDGYTTTNAYDSNGNKISETDPDTAPVNGPTISWAYDSAGQLCRRVAAVPGIVLATLTHPCTDSIPSSSVVSIDTRYSDDRAGNLASAKDAIANLTIGVSYDGMNRPANVTGDQSGDTATAYTYGLSSNTRTDASASGPYTFTLDAYGRQSGLTTPLGSSSTYSWAYNPDGSVASVTDPTGNATSNTFDPLGRLTDRSTSGASGCTSCASLSIAYNGASQQISSTRTIATGAANGQTTYAYDPLARITGYTPPSAGSSQSYTWAGLPDRASITTGSSTNALTYDAASRPTADSVNGTGAYSSDKEGRLRVMPGDRRLSYNALGQLTKVTTSADVVIASYSYDALDRLRTVTESGNTTRLLYVGLSNAVAQEQNSSTGAVIVNHATDMAGTDLFDFSGSSVLGYLYRNDHSDVSWVGSASGAVAATAVYDPFGNLNSSASTNVSGLPNDRWQSSWQDPATGLYYVVARWYSPTLGTFLSEDPMAHAATDPQARDAYAYGSGDPVGQIDLYGQCSYDANTHTFSPATCEVPPRERTELAPAPPPNPLRVPLFGARQKGQTWPGKQLGRCGHTIYEEGCAVTSVAMTVAFYNRDPSYTPDKADYDLSGEDSNGTPIRGKASYIDNSGDNKCGLNYKYSWTIRGVHWNIGSPRLHEFHSAVSTWQQLEKTKDPGDPKNRRETALDEIKSEIKAGRPVVTHLQTADGHFVVIIGWIDATKTAPGNLWINDPAGNGSRIKFFDKKGHVAAGLAPMDRLYLTQYAPH